MIYVSKNTHLSFSHDRKKSLKVVAASRGRPHGSLINCQVDAIRCRVKLRTVVRKKITFLWVFFYHFCCFTPSFLLNAALSNYYRLISAVAEAAGGSQPAPPMWPRPHSARVPRSSRRCKRARHPVIPFNTTPVCRAADQPADYLH